MTFSPRKFQEQAVARHAYLLTHGNPKGRRASLEASVAGFGKTYVASFVAKQMGAPMAVLCPKAVIPHWEQAAEDVGVPITFVTNYEQPRIIVPHKWRSKRTAHGKQSANMTEINRIKAAKEVSFPHGKWLVRGKRYQWLVTPPTLMVFDEVHRCKSSKTQNAKLLQAASAQNIPTLMMSATTAENPMDLYMAGYALGLHDGADFLSWASQYGVRPDGFGFEFKGSRKDLARLNDELFPSFGHRKTFDEIPGFPDTQIDLYPVSDDGAAQKFDKIFEKVAELEEKSQEAIAAVTQRLRARQISELCKVPAIAELVQESVLAGNSAVVFLNFTESITQLLRQLKAIASQVCTVQGGQNPKFREQAIQDFQKDLAHVLVCQISAGGVGISLHDTRGNRPRETFISPPDNARDLIQALGRVRRDGAKSPSIQHIMYLKGSVEERVRRSVERKVHNISLLNDGDLDPLF
jgi:hypothetical protein